MKRSKKLFAVVMTLCLALSMAVASVSVNAATKKPKKIYLTTTSSTVDIKGKVKVSVKKVSPKKASKSVKWKSSNKKVATVSSSGYVTGKKKGTVKITATSKKSKKVKKTIKITVKDLKAKSVTLDKKSLTLFDAQKSSLKATVKGQAGFYNQGVTWKSSNGAVVAVDSKGNVVAKKAGTATITATEKGGSKKATCAVKVNEVPNKITVDKASETVTVEAIVNNPTANSMHYVVNNKGGAANAAMMVTGVTPKQMADALNELSATPWNAKASFTEGKDSVCNTAKKTIKTLAAEGVGNKDYTKLDVSVSYDGKTVTMKDTLDGTDSNNFSMIYANVANNANVKYGCITCNSGCYSGVVANELRLMGAGYAPKNLPAAGTKVTVTYKVAKNYTDVAGVKTALADDNSVVLDARRAESYKDAHIDGAVSADMDGYQVNGSISKEQSDKNIKEVVDKNGTSKKYVLICYTGNKYANAARTALMANGVKASNISILTGGMNAWRSAGEALDHYNYLDKDAVKAKMTDNGYVFLDARKTADYEAGHIAGAVSADVDGLKSGTDKDAAAKNVNAIVTKYGKDKKYIVICYTGKSYAKAATGLLMNEGIANASIQTLDGGMAEWNKSNAAYVVDKHTSSKNIEFANGVTVANLKADLAGSKIYTVLDVRAKVDYDKGHIDGAVSTPSDDETAIMDAVKKNPNGLYVLVCYSGNSKADAARNVMVKNGVDESRIICLEGGMDAWNK